MTIILTGCTAGLGRALVKEFTELGHIVVGGGRRVEVLKGLAEEYPSSHFFQLDVSDEESVKEFTERSMEVAGLPDLVINNAAMINQLASLWQVPADEFDQLTNVNINGVARMIRHTVPHMIERGSGIVVNLSSGWGRSTSPEVAPYCASKWAIEGLTQAMAQELPVGMAAIALNPGVIHTDMLEIAFGGGRKIVHLPNNGRKWQLLIS